MVEVDRKQLRDVDWVLLAAPVILTLFGCIGIYSAAPYNDYWKKQIVSLVLGVVLALVVSLADYQRIVFVFAPFFYAFVIILLLLVLSPLGVEINGNRAWLRLAGISFQPSEFAKLATILMLARYLGQPRTGSLSIKDFVVMTGITMPPVILIFLERDIGTMLTFCAILGIFFFLGGMRKVVIILTIILFAGGLFAAYPHLKDYQKQRIRAVLLPEQVDPRGYGYQTIQSMVAVGSGGLVGKGITHGTQGRLGFLPYAYSDFIAAVIAEETGFFGVLFVLGLYLLLLWRLINAAQGARDRAGSLVVMGIVAVMAFHIFSNLGMVVGLMPIMGLPLPLMSAGGTSVIAVLVSVGLAMSVRLRRFVN